MDFYAWLKVVKLTLRFQYEAVRRQWYCRLIDEEVENSLISVIGEKDLLETRGKTQKAAAMAMLQCILGKHLEVTHFSTKVLSPRIPDSNSIREIRWHPPRLLQVPENLNVRAA